MAVQLGVIGAGAMGGAILNGALDTGLVAPGDVIVCDAEETKLRPFEKRGCATTTDPAGATEAKHVLLAVKPQVFPEVAEPIGELKEETIVISVMAGLSSDRIRDRLGKGARVIRVMPNTPCRVNAGMSAIACGAGAKEGDDDFAILIFSALGRVVRVKEKEMHAVTAMAGSGPAYVFLLAESLEQAGRQVGLSPSTARTLAYQTVLGAGRLLTDSDDADADKLRTAVTSPGGTTAAALAVMFEKELPQIVAEAVIAARDRGMELDTNQ